MTNFMNIQLPAGMVGTGAFSGTFGNPWGGFSSTSSSSTSTVNESYEDYKKRLEKERAEKAKAHQATLDTAQLEKDKEEVKKTLGLDTTIKDLETTKKDIENNTDKKTGTSSIVAKRTKEDSFFTKAGRWLSNAGTAVVNIGKGLVGIEKDGSWNWKKCLKNVAITTAAVGASFIPVVGPIIGYGMLAGGVALGGIGIAKGVSQLKNAKTDAEKDKAQQDICTNALTTALSLFGLRGLGKSLRVGAATSATTTPGVTMAKASAATSRSGLVGKTIEAASNFGRDITVNAFRATSNAVRTDIAAVNIAGGGASGAAKVWWQRVSNGIKNFNNYKHKYDEKIKNMEAKIQNEMDAIDAELLATPLSEQNKIALLREQKFLLNKNKLELRNLGNVKSKADFDKLLTENSATKVIERMKGYTQDAAGNYEIYGRSISPSEYKSFMDGMVKNQKAYQKGMNDIVELKAAVMRKLAKDPTMNASALNEYVPNAATQTRSIWKPSTYRKNNYQIAIGGNSPGYGIRFMKATLKRPELYAVAYGNQMINPQYSAPFLFGQELSKEEAKDQLAMIDENLAIYQEYEKAIDNAKSKDELAQIVTQLSSQNEQGQTEETQNAEANSSEKSKE